MSPECSMSSGGTSRWPLPENICMLQPEHSAFTAGMAPLCGLLQKGRKNIDDPRVGHVHPASALLREGDREIYQCELGVCVGAQLVEVPFSLVEEVPVQPCGLCRDRDHVDYAGILSEQRKDQAAEQPGTHVVHPEGLFVALGCKRIMSRQHSGVVEERVERSLLTHPSGEVPYGCERVEMQLLDVEPCSGHAGEDPGTHPAGLLEVAAGHYDPVAAAGHLLCRGASHSSGSSGDDYAFLSASFHFRSAFSTSLQRPAGRSLTQLWHFISRVYMRPMQ